MRIRCCVRDRAVGHVFPARILLVPSPLARDRLLQGLSINVEVRTSFVRIASNMIVEVDATDADLDQLVMSVVRKRPLTLRADVHPCSEPSIRVPLSLLKELRGQEREAEQQRQVLLTVRD